MTGRKETILVTEYMKGRVVNTEALPLDGTLYIFLSKTNTASYQN